MKKILTKIPGISSALELGDNLFSVVSGMLDSGVGLVSSTLQGVPFFGSTATSEIYDHEKMDEKHYFLIPDSSRDQQYSLYVMRALPTGVPPINDLPKQRILHLPTEDALPMLRELIVAEARDNVETDKVPDNFFTNSLSGLIDEIDKVDDKAFKGVLAIGGLVAMINPLAGAAVAVNAVLPSVGLIVSKYGLKLASDTVTNLDLSRRIKKAEKDVLKQFKAANTIQVVNPLLYQLAKAQSGSSSLDDVFTEFRSDDIELSPTDSSRFLSLTEEAVRNLDDVSDKGEFTTGNDKSYLQTLNRFIRRNQA